MKTVLFYSVNTLMNTPNFAAELELMAKHLESGDRVYVLYCQGDLMSCQVNQEHWNSRCYQCISKFKDGISKINLPEDALIKFPKVQDTASRFLDQPFDTLEDLKNFQIDGLDIGSCVASSLISELKNHKFLPGEYRQKVLRKLKTSYFVYRSLKIALETYQPDTVYLFNGRLAESRPLLRLCQQDKIPCRVIERAGSFGRYALFENTLPHDLSNVKRLIEHFWTEAPLHTREESGAKWFQERRQGRDQGKRSFIEGQLKNRLPEGFEPALRNVVIYNSSEYEYATIKEWKLSFYEDQNHAIQKLMASFNTIAPDSGFRFWLRIHPNLKRGRNIQTREIKKMVNLNIPNFQVVDPDSDVDTYALMSHCEKVISFSSTMGVEACYWGKPSILIGNAFYENLDCCYRPENHEEVISMVLADLPPKDKLGALKYGYYMQNNGTPYRWFRQTSYNDGEFSGKRILSADQASMYGRTRYRMLKEMDKLKTQGVKSRVLKMIGHMAGRKGE